MINTLRNLQRIENNPYDHRVGYYSGQVFFCTEETGWSVIETIPHGNEEHQVIHSEEGIDIYFKPPSGNAEIFNSLLGNRLLTSLGVRVTPTFIVKTVSMMGIGSIKEEVEDLNRDTYKYIVDNDSATLAQNFVFRSYFPDHDWGRDKYDSYVTTGAQTQTTIRYVLDTSHIIFGPILPDLSRLEILCQRLSNELFLERTQHSFGIEAVYKAPKDFMSALERVENLKEIELFHTVKSVVRHILRTENYSLGLPEYYENFALAVTRVLISRKRKLRFWLYDYLEKVRQNNPSLSLPRIALL